MTLREAEVDKLRKRLDNQLQEPTEDEDKKQVQSLKEELTLRMTELSRQKSIVGDLQRACDELRDENRRLTSEVQMLKAQLSSALTLQPSSRNQVDSPSLKNVVADHEVSVVFSFLSYDKHRLKLWTSCHIDQRSRML